MRRSTGVDFLGILVLLCRLVRHARRKSGTQCLEGKFKSIPEAWTSTIPARMAITEKGIS
jgi:hypothetical protein